MFERHVVRKLTAYCHHELTAADSSRVQQHLEICEPCRREYDSIRLTVDLASQMSLQRAPDSLWSDVVSAVDEPAKCGSWKTPKRYQPSLAALGSHSGGVALR